MSKLIVTDELVNSILEGAAWDKAEILVEKKSSDGVATGKYPTSVGKADVTDNQNAIKGIKDLGDPLKGGKSVKDSKEVEKAEGEEAISEDAEHICPLCDTALSEELSEDRMIEHVKYILNMVNEGLEEDADEEEAKAEAKVKVKTPVATALKTKKATSK